MLKVSAYADLSFGHGAPMIRAGWWKRILVVGFVFASCAAVAERRVDKRWGRDDPTRFDTGSKTNTPSLASTTMSAGTPSFRTDVLPVLEKRCVVCHACYDAPCQLKLGSWDGIARGASKRKVYDGERLLEARPTRLFEDAQQPSQWRKMDFFPVLNERALDPSTNRLGSLLYRMLDLKRRHPLARTGVLSNVFDFGVDRAQTCPALGEMDTFEAQHPDSGMPYGLPGISAADQDVVTRWLEGGSPHETLPPLPGAVQTQVIAWEDFFGGESFKERLISRYIYEHLFVAQLYFEDDPSRTRFRLVRSATPTGQPIRIIATRRPTDDPGVPRVYYRLDRVRESIVEKTDMPYGLGPERMKKLRTIFFEPTYSVSSLPSYSADIASDPFSTYADLPAHSRYRFMLDEAQLTMMGFIKGPVCRGQVALNVIEDQFWIFFADPDGDVRDLQDEFLKKEAGNLRLPAAWGSDSPIVLPWLEYKRLQNHYLTEKSQFLEKKLGRVKVDLPLIWDGDGNNPNAALTVFRHYDSATVVKGLIGPEPTTVWVLSYPEFERIHYLLVAGFDVFGNIGHQLNTRLYMDFLRMQAEFNFLAFLPRESRKPLRDSWYRGAPAEVKEHVYGQAAHFDRDTDIVYKTHAPKTELLALLARRMAPVLDHTYDLETVEHSGTNVVGDPSLRQDLEALASVRGASLAFLPETMTMRIDLPGGAARYFTLVRNTAHSNVSSLFKEESRILPSEHTLTVVPGFLGAYVNALYVVPRASLSTLTAAIASLKSEADYARLASRFEIRRTNPDFWTNVDSLQDAHATSSSEHHGLLDLNRYENR